MAEVTPEIALRILEALISNQGTPVVLSRISEDEQGNEINIPKIHQKYTERDYKRIIARDAPQLLGYTWKDLQTQAIAGEDAINFAELGRLARECPDFDERYQAAKAAGEAKKAPGHFI